MRSLIAKLRKTTEAPVGDPELVKAQYYIFVKQIPMLYFILSVNTLALIYTFARFGHPWVTVRAPMALMVFCVWRGIVWGRRRDQSVEVAAALRSMRATIVLGSTLAALFSFWGLALYGYGDAAAKSQIVFFLGMTMIACVFCLTYLPVAAISVGTIGVATASTYFFFADGGQYRAAAVILVLVALGLLVTIRRNYAQFADLVASQRALMSKHAETLNLVDENSRLANLDALTGLPNRRHFIASLAELCNNPDAGLVAMCFVDLDGFKNVNDDYGHEVGDRLIAHTGKAFAELLPEGALLARLGGDEFAVMLGGPEAEARMLAFGAAARIGLQKPLALGTRAVCVGASIGVAAALAGRCDAQELMRRADVAMYQVKANGKGGVMLYEAALDVDRRWVNSLSDEIRAGLAADEFELFYQPIVDARTAKITSLEALLRWPRRPAGALGPDVFIGVAESAGLIDGLGLFALRRACRDCRDLDDIKVSVNISPAQFRDPEFEAKVAAILLETDFPASRLMLEVTEGYLIDNPERAAEVIAALKAMGASVVLDDFGSGYTSINYLQKYGFSAIKIDRSISSRIGIDDKARVLVTGVVYLANGLDMPVTAEGVETEEQARLLRLAGCQNLQGYRYFKPKPIAELVAQDFLAPKVRAVG